MATSKKGGTRKTPPAKKKVRANAGSGKKGPGKSRGGKKPDISGEFKKIFLGIAILAAICLTTAMVADIFFRPGTDRFKSGKEPEKQTPVKTITRESPQKPEPEKDGPLKVKVENKTKLAGLKEKPDGAIVYEVFKGVDETHVSKDRPRPQDHIPSISLIIDDIGYDRRLAMALFDLEPNITFSVLPGSPFGRSLAGRLKGKGAEIMLHLPMEPREYPRINPGPGALLASMSPDVLLDQLRKDLAEVPGAAGVNNHMGSRLTAQADQMNQIFTILKKENLFFVDSRTSKDSQCRASARLLRLPYAQRDVFLDNNQDVTYITGQFRKLIKLAEKHGAAIGIGHPYKATLQALEKELPRLKGKIRIVPASQMTVIPG
ncbi:divergent polysaccharide deacetylase family protein [Desulfospira joergensenii]|uniref:divergent polysaccharide deacetylase family protein n=1 Tax=Desulfospira joergensenii TaxID=53329 RepID=UPI0003B64F53|nr:divergent polysaccharide deacetylase family protein [Desulfospira joergensenii]